MAKQIVQAFVNKRVHTFELTRHIDQQGNAMTRIDLMIPAFIMQGTSVPESRMEIGSVISVSGGHINCTIDHVGTHCGNKSERAAFAKVLTSSPWLHN